MLRKPVVLITGASGEIGHGLITRLAERGDRAIVTLDLNPLDAELAPLVRRQVVGPILDAELLDRPVAEYEIHLILQLAAERLSGKVDFRSLRFPGLISAVTVPSGGTSDFAPEMIHAAAQGKPYACFVRPDTRIPFMAMPDAVAALLQLAAAPRERLTR